MSGDGPSLFCFAVCMSAGGDKALLQNQAHRNAGLFGCDAYVIFSDQGIGLKNSQVLPQVVAPRGVAGALTATWVNADAFIAAWDRIVADGEFRQHEWVVKVDPDAVFLPSRLRQHLAEPRFAGPAKSAIGAYLKNCAAGPRGLQLFGSIEVLTRNAVQRLSDGSLRCKQEVDHTLSGEDLWLQRCLDLLGVQAVEDYGRLVVDGYCPGSVAASPCSPAFVAFHPFKVPEQWLQCWGEANK